MSLVSKNPFPGIFSAADKRLVRALTSLRSLDIGMDTRTPVDDSYKLPFRFTGRINEVTYKIGHERLAAEDRKVMQKALAGAHD